MVGSVGSCAGAAGAEPVRTAKAVADGEAEPSRVCGFRTAPPGKPSEAFTDKDELMVTFIWEARGPRVAERSVTERVWEASRTHTAPPPALGLML